MFILAHISDLHLTAPLYLYELSPKRIIGLLNWKFNRQKYFANKIADLLINDIALRNTDHLVITGDLVNLSGKREIDKSTSLLKRAGNPDSISIVPGNHDKYAKSAQKYSLNAWKNYIVGDKPYIKERLFPYMRVRDNIALIGCSTSILTPPFIANGYFGKKQAEDTSLLLRQAKKDDLFRIIMMHHPPVLDKTSLHNRLFGIKRFQDMINREGAELILHGHTHINSVQWLPNPKNITPVVGVSSACQAIKSKKQQASYNLFYIEKHENNWRLKGERYTLLPDATGMQEKGYNIFHDDYI
ncbi:metallophosphoesterase family protein [Candidatus Liberibacter americanus]|uniref:Phosphohydrolase n=1 Tax=Candidatus Liberibacter americanus str. Sao Paulo TaxID=1261131 RepID=U6B9G1_9HYPH|nr:metallophosphoesterase [Candidatus Liberibacter americanus]AHA28357.1 phosphohydrolase [Candidatus Liberibacter americanus str. Sao Paulo]EMS36646.1 putative phosphoesterase protein [Candidatus Liberibacter americanus PW_SP]